MEEKLKKYQYYNNLMWNLIYIGFGLCLFIIYKVLSDIQDSLLKLIFLLFGISIFFYFSSIIEKTNKNTIKYQEEKDKVELSLFNIRGTTMLRIIKSMVAFTYLIIVIILFNQCYCWYNYILWGITLMITIFSIIFELNNFFQ